MDSTSFKTRNPCLSIKLWVALVLLFVQKQVEAQVPYSSGTKARVSIEHFTPANGLAADKVISVAQDTMGYIWIGTQEGLHRYDGYTLRLYQHDPEDSRSLSDNTVEKIYVDQVGTLWVGTWNGLNRYDPRTDSFHHYHHDPEDTTSLSGLMVIDMQEDAQGRLWVAMGKGLGGLSRYDPETDAFVWYLPRAEDPYSLTANNPSRLYLDRSGDFWIGMGSPFDWELNYGGLNRYDPDHDGFIRYLHDPDDPYSLAHNEIISLYEDQAGVFWVATWAGGVQFLDRKTDRFYPAEDHPNGRRLFEQSLRNGRNSPDPGGVRFLHEDTHGNLWIGNFLGGLDCYNLKTGAITHFSQGAAANGGLTDLAVWSLFEDAQKGLWVSTWNGLNHIRPQPEAFEVIGHGENGQPKLDDLHVEALLLDEQEQIWAGTWAGLERLNSAKGERQLFELGQKLPDKGGLSSMGLSLHKPGPGELWVGTNERGLVQVDLEKERSLILARPDPQDGFPVNVIHEDEAGTIWVGTPKGLFYWDAQSDLTTDLPRQLSAPFQEVLDIVPDQQDMVWLGTPSGLFRLNVQSHKTEAVLTGYNIETILNLGPDELWLGSNSLGLIKFNPVTQDYTVFTRTDGLPGNLIRSLLTDQAGRVWIATNKGIAWMEKGNAVIRTFKPTQMPPIYTFYPQAAIALPDGKLLFGGNGGILQVDPSRIFVDSVAPRPVIYSLEIFDQMFEVRPGAHANHYQIEGREAIFSHDENDLTFEFAGLHFERPADNSFRYKLTPYETEWRAVGTQRTAIYPNLPPGQYTFQVQAANPDGVWSAEAARLEVVILAPWWRTPWAFIAYGVLIVGALFATDRLQRRRLIRAERARAHLREVNLRAEAAEAQTLQLQELDEAKARLYANITHEFRTPLTVILGMAEQIRGHGQQRELIRRNSQNLLRLINQMLDLSKLESGKLQLDLLQGDIIPFLQYLTESFFSMAEEKEIRLLFYPEVEELVMDYDEAKIQHIVYNLLSNALKFTPKEGKVVLHAARRTVKGQDSLQLKVQDTGIGIAEAHLAHIFDRFYQVDTSSTRKGEGTGIGLSLTRDLVGLMNGEIAVVSQAGKGTIFTVCLPISHQAPLMPYAPEKVDPTVPVGTLHPSPPSLASEKEGDRPILVLIEDNADVATYISGLLQSQYHIHIERNGQTGIERVQELVPDIVISDVMMPEKDGYEVCEQLKQDERTSHIPIILLTARSSKEDRLAGLRGGADAYLTKPFEKEELFIRLEKLRELRQALKDRYSGDKHLIQNIAQQQAPNPDEAFLQKLIHTVQERIDDSQLGVNDLCRAANLSNTQVNRKLKALMGKTPSQFIRLIRLQRAATLLENSDLNVSEVAYNVGFSDPNYFSRVFSEEFGYPPSDIRK
ncbi:two-component regulator propeller domain-containing protein [Phaeodactylibacter xiamenensis]|uniref:two-component regulator propeller domain-containing protein n=1 Tax=Phaeodactylibacter xiamenensis TaxID=1524460 RepID=UPI003CCB84EC